MAIQSSILMPPTLLFLIIMTISSSTSPSPSPSTAEGWTPFPKKTVTVVNELTGHDLLEIRCKSKDDDLGRHKLKKKSNFHFRFYNSAWGNTLFYCSFQWGEGIRWFDVYVQERDTERCTHCNWSVKETGPCLTNNHDTWRACYNWNK
ncbi:S-protein homolog 29 [Linum grandiflorum]